MHDVNFIGDLQKSNIELNRASISVHKDFIADNLEAILNDPESVTLENMKKHITHMREIKENDIGTNIIDPTIAIATALCILFDSPIEAQKATILKHKDHFSRVLASTLQIAKYTMHTPASEQAKAAARRFMKNYEEN